MQKTIDLHKANKPKNRLWLGLFSLVFAIGWGITIAMQKNEFNGFDAIYMAYFFILGFVHIYESRGRSAWHFLGEAYFDFNSEQFVLKPDTFKKAEVVNWSDIKLIKDKAIRIYFIHHDGGKTTLDMSTFNYQLVQEIRQTVADFAKEKEIEVD